MAVIDQLAVRLAMGRLLRMMTRPNQPGDDDDYHRCRAIILDAAEAGGLDMKDNRPSWVRDRLKGAQGD